MFAVGQKVRRHDLRMARFGQALKGSTRHWGRSWCLCHKKPCRCLAGTFTVTEIVKDVRCGSGWRISVAGRVKVIGVDADYFEPIPGNLPNESLSSEHQVAE